MNNRLKKERILYTETKLQEALAAIKSGAPINQVSREYKIPRSTLLCKVTKKYSTSKRGPKTVLSKEEESILVNWIDYMCSFGRPLKSNLISSSVEFFIDNLKRPTPFIDGRPGRRWYERFYGRHDGLKSKIQDNNQSAKSAPGENGIKKWFADLENFVKQKELAHIESTRVFIIDEIVLHFHPKNGFDMNSNGERILRKTDEEVTILLSGSAAGQLAPTIVFFDSQEVIDNIKTSLPRDWMLIASEIGRITTDIFYKYIVEYFYPWLCKNEVRLPVILFIDNLADYLTVSLYEFCKEKQIILFLLPSGTSHLLNPLDVGFIPPLKYLWKKNINKLRIKNKNATISNLHIIPVLKAVFDSMNIEYIFTSSFKKTGLYPVLYEKFDYAKLCCNAIQSLETKESDLNAEEVELDPLSCEKDNLENCSTIVIKSQDVEKTKQPEEFQDNDSTNSLLKSFEKYIDPITLQTFRSFENSNEWAGNVEDFSLFNVWKRIVKESTVEQSTNQQPAETNLNNPSVMVLPVVVHPQFLENIKSMAVDENLKTTISSIIPSQYLKYIGNNQRLNLNIMVHPKEVFMDTD